MEMEIERLEGLYREQVALMVRTPDAGVLGALSVLIMPGPFNRPLDTYPPQPQEERAALGKALLDPAWMHGRRRISAYVV